MTYEQIDTIADAYIPLLVLLVLCFIAKLIIDKQYGRAILFTQSALISATCVYAIMALDNFFSIWQSFALDYSTHTALALALVLTLFNTKVTNKVWRPTLITSFVAYAALMLYQEYHTLADILSTTIVLAPGLYFLTKKMND